MLLTAVLLLSAGTAVFGQVVAKRAETRATEVLLCRMKIATDSGVAVDVGVFDGLKAVVSRQAPPLRLKIPWAAVADGAVTKMSKSNGDFKGTIRADDEGLIVERETRFGDVRAELDATIDGSVLGLSVASVTVGGQTLNGALIDGLVGSTALPSADLADTLPQGAQVTGSRVEDDGIELDLAVNRQALDKLKRSEICRR